MGVQDIVRARDRIIGTIAAESSAGELLAELLAALHDVAEFDAAALMLTDPETLLPSSAIVEGFDPHDCMPFWDNELLDPDFLKFNELARSHDPIGTLHEATDGDLARSPRYGKLMAPLGAGDELRVTFTSGAMCWAVASLMRPAELGPFTPEEVRAVRDLVPVAARSLRHIVGGASTAQMLRGPAMLVVAADGSVESTTADAEALITDLQSDGAMAEVTPPAILAAALRAKNNRSATRVALRARGASGSWLKVHASPLGDDGRVAVMIEPARSTDLVPILLDAYGLTSRETEVVLLLSRGISTKEVAAELCISAHTVNDHIKVIFTKVGVTSRGELVAKLFSDHVVDRFHDSSVHV